VPRLKSQPKNRAAGGKHFLRHALLVAQFSDLRADDVLRFGHAPKMELDTKTSGELNCSIIGAISAKQKIG